MTAITNDFIDVACTKCFDTGEYYNGKEMILCECEEGKKLKVKREIEDGDKSGGGSSQET